MYAFGKYGVTLSSCWVVAVDNAAAAAERESESIWGPGPFSPVPKVATHFRWAERIVAYAGLFLRFQFVLRSTTAQRIRLQFS